MNNDEVYVSDKTCESGIDDNGCGSETREDSVLRGRARDELQWLRASAATPPGLHLVPINLIGLVGDYSPTLIFLSTEKKRFAKK